MSSAPHRSSPAYRAIVVALIGLVPPAAGVRWLGTGQLDALGKGRVTVDEIVGVAALIGAWALLAWLCTAILLSAAATVPGRYGAVAGRYAAAVSPRLLRRLVAVLAGTAIVSGAAPALAAQGAPVAETSHAVTAVRTEPVAVTEHRVMHARWRTGHEAAAVRPGGGSAATAPALGRLGSRVVIADQTPLPSLDRPASATTVVVVPGDCLWTIAARHLGPGATNVDIATEWRRWYDANREVIGADPDLILPGQRLTPPT